MIWAELAQVIWPVVGSAIGALAAWHLGIRKALREKQQGVAFERRQRWTEQMCSALQRGSAAITLTLDLQRDRDAAKTVDLIQHIDEARLRVGQELEVQTFRVGRLARLAPLYASARALEGIRRLEDASGVFEGVRPSTSEYVPLERKVLNTAESQAHAFGDLKRRYEEAFAILAADYRAQLGLDPLPPTDRGPVLSERVR